MQAHNLSLHTSLNRGSGLKVKTFVSDCAHIAYQIEGNEE